jgi:hypothetical protein
MITKEQFEQAKQQKDDAQKTINAYLVQEANDFEARWKEFESGARFFTDDELRYSAGARCDQCKAGLAYPKDCGINHQWTCSEELKGKVSGHGVFPFSFYEIKSEDQPSAQGHTTRPAPAA